MFKEVDPVKSAKPKSKGTFNRVDQKMNLPRQEEEILKFWDENKIFEKSLKIRKDAPLYVFYDGPPFATGTPHYGHILTGIMKDIMPRFWTMKGRLVERKWGWDCHGLPIENIAEKELNVKNKKEIDEMGVDKFNEVCRSKILSYVPEWKKIIRRLGRWVDMENAYKTMDLDYMESVWWVFKELWNKGLIYESYRSMHICPRCETTLSQSEVAEGYKDVKDLSLIAEFELVEDPSTSSGQARTFVLAWTTTPWTLIGNVALAINDKIIYCKLKVKSQKSKVDGNYYILAKDRVNDVFTDDEYEVIKEFFGKDLVGKKYKPLFENVGEIKNAENSYQVVNGGFVTTDDGTGIVHIAPAFGEDDLKLGKDLNLPFIQHIGMDGKIKEGYGEFSGLSVKPSEDVKVTDKKIIEYLEKNNLLFSQEEYTHSYPHCWRCETPLLNYATSSWFVAVEKIKDKALALAKEINWSPKHLKSGRFGEWLNGARDWSISRQRYWASVIPIWVCDGEAKIKNQKSKINPSRSARAEAEITNQNEKICNHKVVVGSVKELEELSGQKINDLHKHTVDKIIFNCDKCGGIMKRIPDVLDTWFDSGSMPYAQMHYPFENKGKFENNFPAEYIAEGIDQTRSWFYYLHVLSTAVMAKPAFKNVIVNGIILAEDGKKMAKRLKNYPDPMEMLDKYGADVMRIYLSSSPVMLAENLNFSESDLSEYSTGMLRMLWNSYCFFMLYVNCEDLSVGNFRKEDIKNILDLWILSKIEKLNQDVESSLLKYNIPSATRLFKVFIGEMSNWYIRRSRKRFWKSEDKNDMISAQRTLHYLLVKLSILFAPFAPFISEKIYKNLTGKESVHLADFPVTNKELIDDEIENQMERARKIVEIGLAKRAKAKIKIRQPLSSLSYSGKKLSDDLEQIIADEINVKEVKNSDHSDEVFLDTNLTKDLIAEGSARDIIRAIQDLRKEAGLIVSDEIVVFYQTSGKIQNTIVKFSEFIKKETLAKSISKENLVDCQNSKLLEIQKEKIVIAIKKK